MTSRGAVFPSTSSPSSYIRAYICTGASIRGLYSGGAASFGLRAAPPPLSSLIVPVPDVSVLGPNPSMDAFGLYWAVFNFIVVGCKSESGVEKTI